mmetsp:Transcript_11533/g.37890  ORF Transcript_11533/g.37890 Transcript_11533/m.37890 type:complete len:459 (-) Transcript_11533:195-1571(-)
MVRVVLAIVGSMAMMAGALSAEPGRGLPKVGRGAVSAATVGRGGADVTKPPAWLWLPAVLYSASCWFVMLEHKRVERWLPSWVFAAAAETPSGPPPLWKLVPSTFNGAFLLGRAVERGDIDEVERILGIAVEDLPRVAEAFAQTATEGSRLSRALGLLSFVNVAAALAGLSCAVSVGPAVFFFFAPILRPLLAPLGRVVPRVLAATAGPASMALAASFVAASTRLERPTAGQFAALGSLGVAPAGLRWTLRKWRRSPSISAFSAWLASHLVPAAIATQSHLLGFFAVAAFYAAFVFFLHSYVWNDVEPWTASELASLLLLLPFLGLRTALPDHYCLPFRSAVAVFGTSALGLGELGASMEKTLLPLDSPAYVARNLVSLAGGATALAAGHVLHLPALSNTALVFFLLWAFVKLAEHFDFDKLPVGAFWPCLFLASAGLWRAATWLRAHDAFLPSLLAL